MLTNSRRRATSDYFKKDACKVAQRMRSSKNEGQPAYSRACNHAGIQPKCWFSDPRQ